MSKPITVSEALRLIELAREVDWKATPGDWFVSGGQLRSLWDHDGRNLYVARAGDMDIHNLSAMILWRASYGALLKYLKHVVEYDGISPRSPLAPDVRKALAPLITWADANHPNWRSPR